MSDVRCTGITRAGRPCRAPIVVEGTDPPLCVHHAGLRPPEKFVPEVIEKVLQALRAGNYPEVAAKTAGIHKSTFYDWYARGEAEPDSDYGAFVGRVDEARALGEARNVALIAQAAATNWQAAAWMLERQYPERWARVSQREKPAEERPADPSDPFAEVDELAEARKRRGA